MRGTESLRKLFVLRELSGRVDDVDDLPDIGFEGANECNVGKIFDYDFSCIREDVTHRHVHGKNLHFFNLCEDSFFDGVGNVSACFHFVPYDDFFQALQCKVRPLDDRHE